MLRLAVPKGRDLACVLVGILLGSSGLVIAQTSVMEVAEDLEVGGDLGISGDLVVGGAVDGDLEITGDLDVGEYAIYNYLWVDGTLGKVGLGTDSPIETLTIETNKAVIAIEEGSPPGYDAGYAKFYVDEGEMVVLDDTGTETQLSSHADPRDFGEPILTSFEDPQVELPFSFHHANGLIGKGAVVDLAAAVGDLEAMTGKRYTTVYDLPAPSTAEILERYDWIEIPLEEAWEQVEVMVPETVTEYDFDPETLQVTQVEVPTGEPSAVGTGTYRN